MEIDNYCFYCESYHIYVLLRMVVFTSMRKHIFEVVENKKCRSVIFFCSCRLCYAMSTYLKCNMKLYQTFFSERLLFAKVQLMSGYLKRQHDYQWPYNGKMGENAWRTTSLSWFFFWLSCSNLTFLTQSIGMIDIEPNYSWIFVSLQYVINNVWLEN